MTTFQAIIIAIVQGLSQILPVGADAHQAFLPYFLGWPSVDGLFSGVLALAGAIAIFIYFIHDWAGLISGFLQVILLRRKPMTMDERLPFYLILATLPLAAVTYTLQPKVMKLLTELTWAPYGIAVSVAVFGLPLWLTDYFTRRNKTMSNWTWIDSLVVGVLQLLALIPGTSVQTGSLWGGLARNFNREAAAKFSMLLAFPILVATGIHRINGATLYSLTDAASLSTLSLGVGAVVCFFVSLLALAGFMKGVTRKGFWPYVIYRVLFAAIIAGFSWYQTRG